MFKEKEEAPTHGIVFQASKKEAYEDMQINAYCDPDWDGDPNDRRSTSALS